MKNETKENQYYDLQKTMKIMNSSTYGIMLSPRGSGKQMEEKSRALKKAIKELSNE